jgi:hypothetical protein
VAATSSKRSSQKKLSARQINGYNMSIKLLNLLGWMPNVSIAINLRVVVLRIFSIAIGTFKNIFKLDSELSSARLRVCNICTDRDNSRCGLCGCVLESKTRLKSAECPLGKWGAITPVN